MPTINMPATGANIKAMAKAKGMNAATLSAAFGFNTPQAIYKWFRGDALPTLDNLVILASLLNVTMDAIVVISRT